MQPPSQPVPCLLDGFLEVPQPLHRAVTAAEALARLHHDNVPALAVVEDTHVIGVVGERELLPALVLRQQPDEPIGHLLRRTAAVPASTPLSDALAMLQRLDQDVLVVSDVTGRYLGLVTRARLLQGAVDARRPRRVGGMATPLGVYLTDGRNRGGRGDLALMLTGAYLFGLMLVAQGLAAVLIALCSADPQVALWAQLSDPLVRGGAVAAPGPWLDLLPLPLFLALLRLSPLAGYHSGEHQAVHLLERGLPLETRLAATMPRPHPRCGTHLGVVVTLVSVLGLALAGQLPWWVAVPAGAGLVYWRKLGWLAQQYGTTRPASERQLGAGIAAAKLLLGHHVQDQGGRARRWRRLWCSGLPQVVLGAWASWWVWNALTVKVGEWIIRG